jgi:hypothetical protein
MSKVIITTYNCQKMICLFHNDIYRVIQRKEICNNISNLQFVITFKSHQTPLSAKKILALCDTNGIRELFVCPTKNVAEWKKNS